MQTKSERPVTSGAPNEPVGKTTASVAGSADTPWWESAALAYAKGLADGAQLALEDVAAVLIDTLGAGRQPNDTAKPVDVLIRHRDQLAARGSRGWVA